MGAAPLRRRQDARSVAAFENLTKLCEEHLRGKYKIEVVDLLVHPQLARGDQIVAIPTLVRKLPEPIRKVIGNLSNVERTLVGLQLRPAKPNGASAETTDETREGTAMTPLTIDQLLRQNEDLRHRLEEALRALRTGEVDAVLVDAGRERVYTLETADKPYRLLVEQVPHGAATLTADGAIIYCNRRFAELLRRPLHSLLGKPIRGWKPAARSSRNAVTNSPSPCRPSRSTWRPTRCGWPRCSPTSSTTPPSIPRTAVASG